MNQIQTIRALLIVVVSVMATTIHLRADSHGCAHCGCQQSCQKICRLVCEEKKVEVVCWGCQCEDFCIPGPSKPGCRKCEEVCGTCQVHSDPKVIAAPKAFSWTEWIPGCSSGIYTKKKLMKKTITKKVPSFKWVVEDLCETCQAKCQSPPIPPGVEIPPPPLVHTN